MAEIQESLFDIKVGPQRATLLIRGAEMAVSPRPITRGDIEKKMAALKVIHGIDWSLVERILAEKIFNETHVVARATPPKEGRNAWIEQVIKADVEAKPLVLENGRTDYKNVDNIRQVQKDQVLAIKHPAVPGEPGRDVFGAEIPPQPVKDVELKVGTNTRLSEDGRRLLSNGPGFLHQSSGTICVGEEYVVRGDVDFATGNIRYQGNVRVKGNVTCGFKVEAEGDIVIEGTAEAAELISLRGSVQVMQGVFGQGKGRISAKGGIRVAYAQDMQLECEGILEVEKGLRNCRAVAGGIKADHPRCALIGGSLKSYSDVTATVAGAEGCRTEIVVADKEEEAARRRIPEIEERKRKTETQVGAFDKKLKEIAASASLNGGKLSPEAQAVMNKMLAAYGSLKKSLTPLEEERKRLCDASHAYARRIGRVVLKEKVIQGARLNMYGQVRDLSSEDAGKEWRWAPEDLISFSLST
jgi:uncharacterized protein (DUF342 family)